MQIGNPPRQGKGYQSGQGWDQQKEHRDETIVIAGDAERDLIEHATHRGVKAGGDHSSHDTALAQTNGITENCAAASFLRRAGKRQKQSYEGA
jgi:hypothetical protein